MVRLFRSVDDLGACLLVFLIREPRFQAGVLFDHDRVPAQDELPRSPRREADPVFMPVGFPWYSNDHCSPSLTDGQPVG